MISLKTLICSQIKGRYRVWYIHQILKINMHKGECFIMIKYSLNIIVLNCQTVLGFKYIGYCLKS